MWCRWLLVPLLIAILAAPGNAGIFRKSPRPDPAQRVPQLLKILKDDPEERKRVDAAEELRDYDLKAFPEMMTALIDALQDDPSSSVRAAAANSLGKLRPISQQAGFSLEQTVQSDPSWRVRVAARTTLWQYYLLGYRSGKPTDKVQEETEEPPLAEQDAKRGVPAPKPMPAPPRTEPAVSPYRPLLPNLRRDPAPETPKSKDPKGPILDLPK